MVSSILSYQLATRGVRTSAALNASDSTQIIKQYIDVLLFEKLDNKRIRPTTTVIDIGNSSDQQHSELQNVTSVPIVSRSGLYSSADRHQGIIEFANGAEHPRTVDGEAVQNELAPQEGMAMRCAAIHREAKRDPIQ